MAQFARPDGDITVTSITGTPTNTAGNRYQNVDESASSDTDYVYGTNNTAAEYECSLSDVTDPASSSGHIFRYRVAKTNAGTVDGAGNAVTVTARLMQGTTQIATDTAKTADGTWTEYSYTLTGGEADSITDYTDLRLEFVTSASGGSPANRRGGAVSWAELEVPNAATVARGHAQAQAQIKQTYVVHSQAQADIKQTYNVHAQSQAQIKQTYFVHAQAQAMLPIIVVHGQAQARIGDIRATQVNIETLVSPTTQIARVTQGSIEAILYPNTTGIRVTQSPIEVMVVPNTTSMRVTTASIEVLVTAHLFAFGQAQAYLPENIGRGYGQAQAHILSLGVNSHGQAQGQIKQTYYQHGQAQALIKVTYFAHGQANADIKQTYPLCTGGGGESNLLGSFILGSGQLGNEGGSGSQTCIGPFGQANALITRAISVHGQAQALIDAESAYVHGQSQAWVEQTYNQHGQAQGTILQTYFVHGQSQAQILQTYTQTGQAQGTVLQVYTQTGQAQAWIKTTYYAHGQAQGTILQIYVQHGQAQALIGTISIIHAQAQATILQTYFVSAQAQADIKQTYAVHGQANALIVTTYYAHGQSQAWIESTYNAHGQAQGTILQTYYAHGQANAQILQTYYVHGQSNALISNTYFVHGQANAWIEATYFGLGQAQAKLNAFGVNRFAQARANILGAFNRSGQARTRIKKVGWTRSGQANALISSQVKNVYGQANALIASTIKIVSGQANAKINNSSYYLVDTFTRNLSGSLGTPDIGPAWTYNDIPADLTAAVVDGNKFILTLSGTYKYVWAYNPITIKNAELTAEFYVDAPTVDNYFEFDLRNNAENTRYIFVWYEASTGTWIADDNTLSGDRRGYSLIEPHRVYKIRFIALDTRVRIKIWDTAYPEPETWTIDYTNASINLNAESTSFWFDGTNSTTWLDNYIVRQAATEQNGQAQAYISGGISEGFASAQAQASILAVRNIYGQAQGYISGGFVNQYAQAQAAIFRPVAQAQAHIRIADIEGLGQAMALIVWHRRFVGQAQANIEQIYLGRGQAQGYIVNTQGYAQAQASIAGGIKSGQAVAYILNINIKVAQAQARIKETMVHGQSLATIFRATRGFGQAQARVEKPFTLKYGQAQGFILVATRIHGQALALIIKAQQTGQAQAKILAFGQIKFGQARARILASVTTNAHGQAMAYIKGPMSGQAAALIAGAKYLVRYNGYDLPGYAQQESIDSVSRMQVNGATYVDGSLSQYIGLENKLISLRMKTVGQTYLDVKLQTQKAATLLRSSKTFTRLYIQYWDRYFEALTKKVSFEKNVREANRILDYNIEFETKPWLTSIYTTTISGTGLIDTDIVTRGLDNGGWTPATVTLTGTNITVSGYTSTGEFAGYISISGAVSNFVIDSNTYTTTDNTVMRNSDYIMYVGPGKTIYSISGATSCVISWNDRWYL